MLPHKVWNDEVDAEVLVREIKRIGNFPEEQRYRIGNTLELSRNELKEHTEK